MSKYMIFEAGSRCGFSAEYFFKAYRSEFRTDDELIEVDIDPYFIGVDNKSNCIRRISQEEAEKMISEDDKILIFPADELTRQSNPLVRERASMKDFSRVCAKMYDKREMNLMIGENEYLSAPKTFDTTEVFLRPNLMSAGSKNVGRFDYCVTEYIDIDREYVIDVDNCNEDYFIIYPREVVLQHGYDKYIRFVDPRSEEFDLLNKAVKCFLKKFKRFDYKIFHLQLARDHSGKIWYIESSKRLSGTSVVNSLFGFNPFASLNGRACEYIPNLAEFDKWYRYEDLIKRL